MKIALLPPPTPEFALHVAAAIRPGSGDGASSNTSSSIVKSGLLQPPLEPHRPLAVPIALRSVPCKEQEPWSFSMKLSLEERIRFRPPLASVREINPRFSLSSSSK